MTEHLKQSISALLDEEISEIEVHRLLREFDNHGELKASWVRFQQIRAVSQGHHHLTESQHLSLHDKISAAIADEDSHEWQGPEKSGWQKSAAGFAIAATLVFGVMIGINTQQAVTDPGAMIADGGPEIVDPPVSAGFNSDEATTEVVAFNEDDLELRELDEVKQQQLREYLMRHDRMSQMNNQTMPVTFPAGSGPVKNGRN